MSSDGRNAHVNVKPEPNSAPLAGRDDRRAGGSPRGVSKQDDPGDDRIECGRRKARPHLRASVHLTPILIEIQHYDRATVPGGTHSPIFWMRPPARQRRNTQLSRRRHGATIFQFQRVASNVAELSLRDAILLVGLAFGPLQELVLHICINRLLRQVGTASETAERSFGTMRSATRPKLGLALN
jgi:hypothetical protein